MRVQVSQVVVTESRLEVCLSRDGQHWIYKFLPGEHSKIRIMLLRSAMAKEISKMNALRLSRLIHKATIGHRILTAAIKDQT